MSELDTLTAYYQNLLIMQYHDKERAQDTIGDLARETLSDMVWTSVRDAFDINTAVGVQLDLLGKYVGAYRQTEATTELADSDLRFLIKMKAIKNASDNSMKQIDDYLWLFFGDIVKAINNKDMSMTYQFTNFFSSIMTFARDSDALPRPLSVAIILETANNLNGDFGYSMAGTADVQIGGYGFTPDDAPIVDEANTSYTASILNPIYAVLAVSGVWLSTDPGHAGVNYYSGGSFTEQVITLGTPLPGPNTAVLINYTAHLGGTYLVIN